MRPLELTPLFRPLASLPGLGPKLAQLMQKLVGGPRLADLVWHLPVEIIDRRHVTTARAAPEGKTVTLKVRVDSITFPARKGLPVRVRCLDESGFLELVYFHAKKDWLEKQFPLGAEIAVSGRVDQFRDTPQMVHPDIAVPVEELARIATLEAVYPLTQGITNRVVQKAMDAALPLLPDLPEWLDAAFAERQGFPGWRAALHTLHKPAGAEILAPDHPARTRLAYDELLANQLALELIRRRQRQKPGRSFVGDGRLRHRLTEALSFSLTGAQRRSLEEIAEDMAAPARMLRLLQGDVGSGKTIVAAMSMLIAIECGAQAALMAPTEILARQHAEKLRPLFTQAGVRMVILTGRDKGKARETLLHQIESGAAQAVIGTHALFQDDVAFADLGLAVIDEQHRFGVHQRLQLSAKGAGTDVLVMTATPIPRTLTLTAYGDMDVSRLDEKPPGRSPIDTRLLPLSKMGEMVEGLARQVATGARAYWVCPLVEESEVLDLAAATERFSALEARFPGKVGLVHGRMKAEDKDRTMSRFASGELTVLVATTVIEVGVDVPEATLMVIEHAERFGLAQLHQLRGRVGRGSGKSFCILMYGDHPGETAKARLTTLRDTEDGFVIAERDLELRGSGEILGTKQSGLPEFRLADLERHGALLAVARDDARLIVSKDPELQTPRGQALRTLLYLFERDQAAGLMRSG